MIQFEHNFVNNSEALVLCNSLIVKQLFKILFFENYSDFL